MCEVQLQGTPDDRTKGAEQRQGRKKEKPNEYRKFTRSVSDKIKGGKQENRRSLPSLSDACGTKYHAQPIQRRRKCQHHLTVQHFSAEKGKQNRGAQSASTVKKRIKIQPPNYAVLGYKIAFKLYYKYFFLAFIHSSVRLPPN